MVAPDFNWKVRPRGQGDSPHRYRALYGFATTNLNIATNLWLIANYLCDPTRAQTRQLASDSYRASSHDSIEKPNRSGMTALQQSMIASRELFLISDEALSRWTFVIGRSDRFPTFFITRRVEARMFRNDYNGFLEREARPGAMALMAGALQLRDQAIGNADPDLGQVPVEHSDLIAAGSPSAVAARLGNNGEPQRTAIVAWLEDQKKLSYRLWFNLACYHSRESKDNATEVELETALTDLKRSIEGCPPPEAQRSLYHQARTDPALTALRVERESDFNKLVPKLKHTINLDHSEDDTEHSQQPDLSEAGDIPRTLVRDDKVREALEGYLQFLRMWPGGLQRRVLFDGNSEQMLILGQMISDLDGPVREHYLTILARLLFLSSWPEPGTSEAGLQRNR
jgi:hypothetical protein